MFVKITSADWEIFKGEAKKITVPTERGQITILPHHQPLVSVVVPGIVKIGVEDQELKKKFWISEQEEDIFLSVSKWVLYVDGENVYILTSAASADVKQKLEVLEKMKQELEEELRKLKSKGSVEEIEKALINLQKISADIKLYKLKHWKY